MKTERDTVLCGTKIGEHRFTPETAIQELKERIVDKGCTIAYVRPTHVGTTYPQEEYVKWAKYLADNKVYFHYGAMAQNPPEGKKTKLDKETVLKIREVAGEYFLGEAIREPGTHYACKGPGYFTKNRGREAVDQKGDAVDMEDAHNFYKNMISYYATNDRESGMPGVLSVDATTLSKYNLEGGVDIPILEVMNGNPDELIPSIRGAAKAYGKDKWFTLLAHEWYGGMRNDDVLKRKRLKLAMKYLYMSGTNSIMLESGDEAIRSYGYKYDSDSEYCRDYQEALADILNLIKEDHRPKGGPKVKFGFLFGLHDGWTGFCQSSVWNQFYREEWGHHSAEASWRILDAIGTKRKWADVINYGDNDTSAMPAYGTYDIVPIEADVDALSKYEHLIFLGWNTMTDENMDKLTEYVRRGGKLLLSGAHLNYSTKRVGEYIPPRNDKLEALCGCRYTGKDIRTNFGTKFEFESLEKKHLYPGTRTYACDPLYSAGFTDYMELELRGAYAVGCASDTFYSDPLMFPTVLENKVGDGLVTFVASKDYPGALALYPLYNGLVREQVSSSARNCDIKVIASEKLRYTVYEGNKIYLLNTDYDLPITVKIIYGGKERLETLDSLQLKTIII